MGKPKKLLLKNTTEVVIPKSVTKVEDDEMVTYKVTNLGDYCFSRCSALTSVDIPSSVTSLEYDCFYYCI